MRRSQEADRVWTQSLHSPSIDGSGITDVTDEGITRRAQYVHPPSNDGPAITDVTDKGVAGMTQYWHFLSNDGLAIADVTDEGITVGSVSAFSVQRLCM